ncbi:MAG: hypothetical protein M3Y07_04635 [Acidobacteriota bacterium]|nr:hypothetical protein [Acidobacteriota bacterium]
MSNALPLAAILSEPLRFLYLEPRSGFLSRQVFAPIELREVTLDLLFNLISLICRQHLFLVKPFHGAFDIFLDRFLDRG